MTSVVILTALRGSYNGFALSRVCRRVPQHYDAGKTGNCLLQDFEQSGAELRQIEETPVTLPPGCARLFKRPLSIGSSSRSRVTIGIFAVAVLAATVISRATPNWQNVCFTGDEFGQQRLHERQIAAGGAD